VLALAEACLIGNHIGIGLKIDVNCIFRVRGEDSLELLKGLKYGPTNGEDMVNMPRVDAKVMDHSQEVHDSSNGESVSSFSHKVHNGGSILDILDDMVQVGHSMGYNLDGCLKDMERIIGSQRDEDVFK
ncbi:hypothetical protein Tco_1231617, partial [Tanacetum coccineum]